jgi:hypothetical protein
LPEELSGCYRDRFTGTCVCAEKSEKVISLSLAEVLSQLPVALLERS